MLALIILAAIGIITTLGQTVTHVFSVTNDALPQ